MNSVESPGHMLRLLDTNLLAVTFDPERIITSAPPGTCFLAETIGPVGPETTVYIREEHDVLARMLPPRGLTFARHLFTVGQAQMAAWLIRHNNDSDLTYCAWHSPDPAGGRRMLQHLMRQRTVVLQYFTGKGFFDSYEMPNEARAYWAQVLAHVSTQQPWRLSDTRQALVVLQERYPTPAELWRTLEKTKPVKAHDRCPCGSGRRYEMCCGRSSGRQGTGGGKAPVARRQLERRPFTLSSEMAARAARYRTARPADQGVSAMVCACLEQLREAIAEQWDEMIISRASEIVELLTEDDPRKPYLKIVLESLQAQGYPEEEQRLRLQAAEQSWDNAPFSPTVRAILAELVGVIPNDWVLEPKPDYGAQAVRAEAAMWIALDPERYVPCNLFFADVRLFVTHDDRLVRIEVSGKREGERDQIASAYWTWTDRGPRQVMVPKRAHAWRVDIDKQGRLIRSGRGGATK